MEIPKSLDSAWKNVSQDKTITKKDYELLVKAAAPKGENSEFDNSEIEFLGNLKSELEKSGGSKGSIPTSGLSFTKAIPPKVVSEADIKDVPDTLKESWNKAIEDGNINQDEYKFLLEVASPNWNDEELDPKEKQFLGNLQALLKASNNSLSVAKPEIAAKTETTETDTETTQADTNKPGATNNVSPQTNESSVPFKEVKTETDESLKALTDVNNILDSLGDDPDFAPLRGIVNQRLANSSSAKEFSANATKILSSIEPGKTASITQGKTQLQDLYDKLPQGVKANPEITNIFTHAMGTLDSQISASRSKKPSGNTTETNSATQNNTPGAISFVDSNESVTQENAPAQKTNSSAKPKKPVLLNWPGYTSETKGALKSAFGSRVNGTSMPILSGSEGLKIAKAFGVKNIRQLQQLVKAKSDGQFGPETFFKAKVYIANEMNKPGSDTERLGQMLSALGNDREVKAMKQSVGAKNIDSSSVQQTSAPESKDNGVPDSLKTKWNEVTADGKLSKSDYDKLIEAAAPNKKNEEFDDSELKFLAGFKEKFKGTNEIEVEKPSVETAQNESSEQPQSIEDSIPASLKSAWKTVTADGKLTKSDYQKLVDAASPNKKNTEFDNSELEFLATVKDMFDKNKVDELDVAKPQVANKPAAKPQTQQVTNQKPVSKPTQTTDNNPSPKSQQVFSFTPPQSLKAAWDKISADGKITSDDYAKLISAAAPGKQNSEFENDEIEFLADLKKKLSASNNVISVAKK